MPGHALRKIVASGLVLLGGVAWSAEPGGTVLPAPRVVPGEVVVVPSVEYVRPNPYDVWQNYGVNRFGQFRPLVAPSPDGLRYVYNGVRYPWWQNYPGNFQTTISNAATFQQPHPAPVILWREAP
jgi:hypothetical protein